MDKVRVLDKLPCTLIWYGIDCVYLCASILRLLIHPYSTASTLFISTITLKGVTCAGDSHFSPSLGVLHDVLLWGVGNFDRCIIIYRQSHLHQMFCQEVVVAA